MRTYPALLSTEAVAQAWARAGAPEGSVVVADYQASPRGRAGLEWRVTPGMSLGFSLVLRPRLAPEREGWLYTAVLSGLADALGAETRVRWPDESWRDGALAGSVGVHVELGPGGTDWAVANVLVPEAGRSRVTLLATIVEAIEERLRSTTVSVLADYLRRCDTIGRSVEARLIPMGPGGVRIAGRAVTALADGALVLETADARRVAVRPQHLGLLAEA